MSKNYLNYSKVFSLITYVIMMIILIQIYYYLIQINNCECFNKNDKYSVDVEFMKFYQILEMILLTIFVGTSFITSSKTKQYIPKMGGIFLSTLTFIILTGISIYMTYNTFNFYMNVKQDCKCANSWYRYFIYFEGIGTFISVLRVIFMTLFILIGLSLFYNQFS
jgi:hypothetical protein